MSRGHEVLTRLLAQRQAAWQPAAPPAELCRRRQGLAPRRQHRRLPALGWLPLPAGQQPTAPRYQVLKMFIGQFPMAERPLQSWSPLCSFELLMPQQAW